MQTYVYIRRIRTSDCVFYFTILVVGVDCRRVDQLQNGDVSVQSTYLGGSVFYTCHRGYDRVGVSVSTCKFDDVISNKCSATWSDQPPTCRSKFVVSNAQFHLLTLSAFCLEKDCGTLTIDYGNVIVVSGDGRYYRSVVKYGCRGGYELTQGTEYRTCEETGKWSGKQPNCTSKPLL